MTRRFLRNLAGILFAASCMIGLGGIATAALVLLGNLIGPVLSVVTLLLLFAGIAAAVLTWREAEREAAKPLPAIEATKPGDLS